MNIVSGIVLYAVLWFLCLFILLPVRLETQGDRGEIVPGTHAGAPANLNLRRKALWTTLLAFAVWLVIATAAIRGWLSVDLLDVWDRPSSRATGQGG